TGMCSWNFRLGLKTKCAGPALRGGIARLAADRAVDKIRDRFGWEAVKYGSTLGLSHSVPDEFRELAEKNLHLLLMAPADIPTNREVSAERHFAVQSLCLLYPQ